MGRIRVLESLFVSVYRATVVVVVVVAAAAGLQTWASPFALAPTI